jgi:hypothetical protein
VCVCVSRSRRGAGKTARTTNPNGPVLTHTEYTHRGKEIKESP